jgi:hypothetical protein
MMLDAAPENRPRLTEALAQDGYAFVAAPRMQAELTRAGALSDWEAFARSWDQLELDQYMADHGRYRRRRHAVYAVGADGATRRLPHQPHYQSVDYNPLNGGVERWFAPIAEDMGQGPSLSTILRHGAALFGALAPAVRTWHVEVHQFRIEAHEGEPGRPTPEGVHRDGVDYVLVLLIRRRNIKRGTTTVHAPDGRLLGSFTLTEPFDAALVDDARVFHGVTPVEPVDPASPAYRDVLVVTYRRAS